MTDDQILGMLTLEQVEAWAASLEPTAGVGYPSSPTYCPVHEYLLDQGATGRFTVGVGCVTTLSAELTLPDEISALVDRIDFDNSILPCEQVTAAQLLGYIRVLLAARHPTKE